MRVLERVVTGGPPDGMAATPKLEHSYEWWYRFCFSSVKPAGRYATCAPLLCEAISRELTCHVAQGCTGFGRGPAIRPPTFDHISCSCRRTPTTRSLILETTSSNRSLLLQRCPRHIASRSPRAGIHLRQTTRSMRKKGWSTAASRFKGARSHQTLFT